VVYPTLEPNTVHTAVIIVTNSLGHGITVTNQFDTFSQTNYMFEAEDFDFNGGQYVTAMIIIQTCMLNMNRWLTLTINTLMFPASLSMARNTSIVSTEFPRNSWRVGSFK